jgi:hypothetical protein
MESILWSVHTLGGVAIAAPVLAMLGILLVWCWDYPLVLVYRLVQRARGHVRRAPDPNAQALPVLVVIPSLLRNRDELTSMMGTVESVAHNGYPGDLTIVLTIDGTDDAPELYSELQSWAAARRDQGRLFVTGTQLRHSKPMAIEHAMRFTKQLVADSVLPAFPPVYISTDADAELGPHAIERIVYRLQRRNRLTG